MHRRNPADAGGQEAGRAAVRDAAAVPLARVRPGHRHRAQLAAKYGDKMDFIHQEVYVDNDVNKGPARRRCGRSTSPTEPWLFVADSSGKVTSPRLEGSIGVQQFEDAVKSGL